MAAFDPATIQLQYELLGKTNRDLARDQRLLDKQPKNSRSKMATTLRERIAEGQRVAADLTVLVRFMEALNREEPDGVPPGLGRAEWAVLADEWFAARVAGDAERCVCGCDASATDCFCGQNCRCNELGACPVCDGESGGRR